MSKNNNEGVEELLEPVKVAVALGAKIYAPAGTLVFGLLINRDDSLGNDPKGPDTSSLGIYESRDAAKSGLREWILKEWESRHFQSNPPWEDEYGVSWSEDTNLKFKKQWLEERSDQEIIDLFFSTSLRYRYSIYTSTIGAFYPRVYPKVGSNEQK